MRYSYKPGKEFYDIDITVKDDRVVLELEVDNDDGDGSFIRVLILDTKDLNFFQYLIGKYNDVCCD